MDKRYRIPYLVTILWLAAFGAWTVAAVEFADTRASFRPGEILSAQSVNRLFGLIGHNFAIMEAALAEAATAADELESLKQDRVSGACAVGGSIRAIEENGAVSCHIHELGDLAEGQVTTEKIANVAITTAALGDDAVHGAKLSDSAAGNTGLQDGAVGTANLQGNAVGTDNLRHNSVRAQKLAVILTARTTATLSQSTTVTAVCPSGTRLLSGGYDISSPTARLVESRGIVELRSWQFRVELLSGSPAVTVTVEAYCLFG